MQTLINSQSQVAEDQWLLLDNEQELPASLAEQSLLLTSERWAQSAAELTEAKALGLQLESHELIEDFAADLARFSLIALHFASFTDGRHFSNARLLRERYGFKGELRATGDVAVDQLFYLKRCGFDSFMVPATQQELAISQLATPQLNYQAAVDQQLPRYRRA